MQKIALLLFKFYIESSLHVALSVYCLLRIFLLKHQLVYDENLVYSIFYGSITAYNFVKYAPIARLHHRRLTNFLKLIQLFSLACFIIMCYYLFLLPFRTLVAILSGTVLTILYTIPFIKTKNARSISGIKIYIVAISWAIVTVATPAIHFQLPINIYLFIEFLQIVLLTIVLIIPFDIRDLTTDSKQLKTIPQQLGIKKTKILGSILLIFYFILDISIQKETYIIITTEIMVIISFVLLLKTAKNPAKYYCSFIVESVPIVWFLLLSVLANH